MSQSTENTCECCGSQVETTCYCPLTGVINTVSKKYAMQLISVIGTHGPIRFGELENHLSTASTSTLTNRLDELVKADLVTRTQYNEIPPRVEYELTHDGIELREKLEPLLEWASMRE